ncbi:COQ9 family protein [Meridianimarinicoccus roseus]|uniref:COQ9 family protein n=1 Tax=Meridianimarinicoccus roseus TaxID=2072018 RepID=A0A2V2LEJ2_9RHOB|nr:COQ9 family protein [Meridianimarinicoccus roseus]PWR03855.1 COQ9 family protein [Meridianimarinicoccus roseus]
MTDAPSSPDGVTARLLEAITPHVPFDGWSQKAFRMAVADAGVEMAVADAVCPRGAVDLAVAYHRAGDAEMVRRIHAAEMGEMRFRDRVAAAVRFRLEAVEDKELVRRGSTLFALPMYAGDGARLVWGTVDRIWDTLGDTARDYNWYTKRATLAGVYSATVLYWLGDDSDDNARTWAFLDRRVDDVMRIEKAKSQARENALLKPLVSGAEQALAWVKAPDRGPRTDMPGSWQGPR